MSAEDNATRPWYGIPTDFFEEYTDNIYRWGRLFTGFPPIDPNLRVLGAGYHDADIRKLMKMLDDTATIFASIAADWGTLIDDNRKNELQFISPEAATAMFVKRTDEAKAYLRANSLSPSLLRQLDRHGLLDEELRMKEQSLNWAYNLYGSGRATWARKLGMVMGEPILNLANSFLKSLNFVPGAGAASEIKDHFHGCYRLASAGIDAGSKQ
jgi:hypothetical protein